MITYAITDRQSLRGESLLDAIARNLQARVTWIQLREKDLCARDLYQLTVAAQALPNPAGTRFIVNSRVDVALAANASGAHLPADSPAPKHWRTVVPPDFLMGVSCHTPEEAAEAERGGADYVLFGPVFAPLSKSSTTSPLGLHGLRTAVHRTRVPVLALGGVTQANAASCLEQGAAGVAGISLFLNATFSC